MLMVTPALLIDSTVIFTQLTFAFSIFTERYTDMVQHQGIKDTDATVTGGQRPAGKILILVITHSEDLVELADPVNQFTATHHAKPGGIVNFDDLIPMLLGQLPPIGIPVTAGHIA